MKQIVREYEFSPEQLKRVREAAKALDLTETTVRILFARGVDTEEKIRRFLRPGAKNFLSPFLMRGMKEAAELIRTAKEEEWRVAVFGDYDADGIGASAVLSRALREYGIEPYVYVPERSEGYGLNLGAIDKIFDEFLPDLFITVDCGISNRKEVEYIKEQGAYVIVTDHHELPEEIPDCICINPKFDDGYPYDNLCGAGVAFKLAQALIGDKANALLDFAALSTVADSVPLLGENRDIVSDGLRLLERSPRPAFSALLGRNAGDVAAQTLAFTVAPRINAAGRMGNANVALRLFTSDDEREIFDLAVLLNEYNAERQKCCDELYAQASALIRKKGAFGHIIMLAGDNWNTGFVGIVAARIAEEYGRPALLFVKNGDMLKGSARSIESVNIFDALKNCSQFIEEFGGHAQAAGINVRAENFEALERALDEYIGKTYRREDFIPKIYISEEFSGGFPKKLAKELNALEPYGVGHRRPLFATTAQHMDARPVKPDSPHLAVAGEGMDFMYFGGAKHLKLLESDLKKTVVFECNLSRFRGKEYLKGFIRTVVYDGMSGEEAETEGFENALLALKAPRKTQAQVEDTASLNAFIEQSRASCSYGLCAVASERRTLKKFPALRGLSVDVFEPSSASLCNTVLVAPLPDCDLSGYRDIVFLDTPAAVSVQTGEAKLYRNGELCGYRAMNRLSLSREDLLGIFALLRKECDRVRGNTYAEAARSCGALGADEKQFIFALAVFEELGLIAFSDGRVKMIRGARADLGDSVVYSAVARLQQEG